MTDDLENHFSILMSDRALFGAFKARYPHFIRYIVDDHEAFVDETGDLSMPRLDDVTAIQAGLFDNSEKKRPHPWTMNLKVWTQPRIDFGRTKPRWEKNAMMWAAADAPEAAKRAARKKNVNPISESTLQTVLDVAGQGGDLYVGVARQTGQGLGNRYVNDHVVAMEFSGGVVMSAYLSTPGGAMAFPPFVETDSKGVRLRGNCRLQSRHSTCEHFTPWVTG